jgi:hypothetical protein
MELLQKDVCGSSQRRRLALIVVLCLAGYPSVHAATEYAFTVTSEGAYPAKRSGRIVVAGERWRADLDPEEATRAYDSVIEADGARRALNHGTRTWFELSTPAVVRVHSLLDFHRANRTDVTNLTVEQDRASNASSDQTSFRYKTRTKLGPETVRGKIWGGLTFVTRPDQGDRPPISLLFSIASGSPAVDQRIQESVTAKRPHVWSVDLTLNRQFEGASPMAQTIRWSVDDARHVTADPAIFVVPAGYTHQLPQIGAPGKP